MQVCIPVYCARDGLLLPQKPVQKCICLVKQQHRGQSMTTATNSRQLAPNSSWQRVLGNSWQPL